MNYKLCYIEDAFAYFTIKPLEEQWGDDWNDKPYEDNSGPPYDDEDEIIIIAFQNYDLYTPADNCVNCYSVEDINRKNVPWLRCYTDEESKLYAGASIEEFKQYVYKHGGTIFLKEKR